MKPNESILSSLLASLLIAALGACGGAKSEPAEPSPQPTASAPDSEAAADADSANPAGDTAQPAADKPALPTTLGPSPTPHGVVFNFKPGAAKGKIYLAGNFNDWNPSNNDYLMKDDDGDGIWTIVVKLSPGTYQYKYVADGQWIKDPRSPAAHPDGFGGQNGKFTVE